LLHKRTYWLAQRGYASAPGTDCDVVLLGAVAFVDSGLQLGPQVADLLA
jgi:hypothetical protein